MCLTSITSSASLNARTSFMGKASNRLCNPSSKVKMAASFSLAPRNLARLSRYMARLVKSVELCLEPSKTFYLSSRTPTSMLWTKTWMAAASLRTSGPTLNPSFLLMHTQLVESSAFQMQSCKTVPRFKSLATTWLHVTMTPPLLKIVSSSRWASTWSTAIASMIFSRLRPPKKPSRSSTISIKHLSK